jgi:hypothetical protein
MNRIQKIKRDFRVDTNTATVILSELGKARSLPSIWGLLTPGKAVFFGARK